MKEYAKCARCGLGFWRDESWKALCLACWRERMAARAHSQQAVARGAHDELLPDEAMMRRLLQLCHPDRHGGSEASTVATRWLLSLRERLYG